jgi:hypothetical protein
MADLYDIRIFLNCPFDRAYQLVFRAIIFAIYDCGFRARCALEESDSGELRLRKIIRLLKTCRYSIHDLSRIHGRLNMPLELGVELGLRESGRRKWRNRRCLVLDSRAYRYQKVVSDLAGCDTRFHGNSPDEAIRATRDWLRTASRHSKLPGAAEISRRYRRFLQQLPDNARRLRLKLHEVVYLDYVYFVTEWLRANAPPVVQASRRN